MATGDDLDFIRARDLTNLSGFGGDALPLHLYDQMQGLPLRDLDSSKYAFELQIPLNGTPLATGLTFLVGLVRGENDPEPAGLVVRLGIQVKKLTGGTDDFSSTGAGTEQGFDATMAGAFGILNVASCAVAAANLDGAVAGSRLLVVVRRIGTHANDTHRGAVGLTGITVRDT